MFSSCPFHSIWVGHRSVRFCLPSLRVGSPPGHSLGLLKRGLPSTPWSWRDQNDLEKCSWFLWIAFYIFIYIYIYVCVCTYIYIRMYVCMYVLELLECNRHIKPKRWQDGIKQGDVGGTHNASLFFANSKRPNGHCRSCRILWTSDFDSPTHRSSAWTRPFLQGKHQQTESICYWKF